MRKKSESLISASGVDYSWRWGILSVLREGKQ